MGKIDLKVSFAPPISVSLPLIFELDPPLTMGGVISSIGKNCRLAILPIHFPDSPTFPIGVEYRQIDFSDSFFRFIFPIQVFRFKF